MSRRLAAVFLLVTSAAFAAPQPAAKTGAAPASPLAKAIKEVERIRGLEFTKEVAHVSIDRSELPKHLREQLDKTMPYPVADFVRISKALQLVDGDDKKLEQQLFDLFQSQVLAYYDPISHTYYSIRQLPDASKDVDPAMLREIVAVHELTHALQDQRYDLGAKDQATAKDQDAQLALHSVIEGEATLVMMGSMLSAAGKSLDDIVKSPVLVNALSNAAAVDKSIDPSAPKFFVESLKFPYIEGLKFVIEAYRRGGWKAMDEIYAHPPATTREIIHSSEYFDHEFKPEAFDAKPVANETNVISTEHLGEFNWAFLLGSDVARGWVNDRATIVKRDKATAVFVEAKWESAMGAQRFAESYAKFLADRGINAKVSLDGVTVHASYEVPQS